MNYSIETFNLTKTFGAHTAVDQLKLRVIQGSFHGFLGPNGAGKSTTIKMLTGMIAPTSGEARLLGYDLKRSTMTIKKRTGVVPEELCLFENLTGPEYLTFMGRMYSLPRKVAVSRCWELLELMGLMESRNALILEYSHGMKKKLALCAAVIHDPDLLFLDEPFEGVDAIGARIMREVLEGIRRRGATIFLTSHILEVVERLCTHVSIINAGKRVWEGALDDLAADERLDDAFLRLVGKDREENKRLSWLPPLSQTSGMSHQEEG